MAGRKADQKDATPTLTVLSAFAYAARKDGEVRQLVKGDVVDPGEYTKESIDHLVDIGFLGDGS